MLPHRRAAKRIKNRLAKRGLTFLRFEQGDRNLDTMRVILETRRSRDLPSLGRAFSLSTIWLKTAPPRVIADRVISDYVRGYGHCP